MLAGPCIFVPMFKTLGRADDLTDAQKKKINDASRLGNLYFKQMKTNYIDAPILAFEIISPFDNAVPIIPWL